MTEEAGVLGDGLKGVKNGEMAEEKEPGPSSSKGDTPVNHSRTPSSLL